jgi:hypothetical protein
MDMDGDDREIGRLPDQVGPETGRIKGFAGIRISRGEPLMKA